MLSKIDLQLFLKLIHIGFQLFLKHEGHYVGSQENREMSALGFGHVYMFSKQVQPPLAQDGQKF